MPSRSRHRSRPDEPSAGRGREREEPPLSAVVREARDLLRLEAAMHRHFEVGIVTAGRQEWQCAELTTLMDPGDVYLAAPWEPHGWRALEPGTRTVHLNFLPTLLGGETLADHPWQHIFAVGPRERPRVTGPRMREEVLALGREIEAEIARQRPAWLQAVRLGLLRVLLILAREWQLPVHHGQEGRVRASDLARVVPALDLVRRCPERRVSRREAAAACGLSIPQFSLVFRRAMGVSFGSYGLQARLDRAAYLLFRSDLSIEGVARQAGFVDGSHLSRVFPRHYGVTPAEYRAQGWRGRPQPG